MSSTVLSPHVSLRGLDAGFSKHQQEGAGIVPDPTNFKRIFLQHVVEVSLNETTMYLWGEYDQVTDDDLVLVILPALKRAAWRSLDLRRSQLTKKGIQALLAALPSSKVKEVCLGAVNLGDEGAALVAKALPSLRNIEILNLFDNGITDKGVASLCKTLPLSSLKELVLDNNEIGDDGALSLSRAIDKSSLQKLKVNMNLLTSFGADRLTECVKRSSLTSVGFRGNEEVLEYSRMYLHWVLSVCRSEWYRTSIALLSPRYASRTSSKSSLQVLPQELIRRICLALCSADMLLDESFDELDAEDDYEEDYAGYEEDFVAAVTHHRRRCSSLASVVLTDILDEPISEW